MGVALQSLEKEAFTTQSTHLHCTRRGVVWPILSAKYQQIFQAGLYRFREFGFHRYQKTIDHRVPSA
jgi:hypothetical protein